jgi:UDPglucose 6-dehydrogenase
MGRCISVVGLGKLGASIAAAIASRGIDVIGVDVNHAAVDAINDGRAPVQETGLAELIAASRSRLRATLEHTEAILNSELTFVIVPTPSDDHGAFSLQYVAYAFREIGRALAQKRERHTVVLTSTVLPGAARYGLIPILESYSAKSCGKGFGFCYSPEFIALGSVIRDFLNPDFLLIGEFDAASGDHLASCYRDVVANDTPIARMSLENAELTKISVNAYVTSKITFANMLADICDRMPGGDVDVVSNAMGLDSRIGRRYLTGGPGYGGPCFPRDNVALSFFAKAVGASADLPQTVDRLNRSIVQRIVEQVAGHVAEGGTVAVLGLSYKPMSHVIEEAQAIQIVTALVDRHYRVVAFDPLAGPAAQQEVGSRAVILDSISGCVRDADAILVVNADPAFTGLTPAEVSDGTRSITVIDLWRCLSPAFASARNIKYVPYGRAGEGTPAAATVSELWRASAARHVGV